MDVKVDLNEARIRRRFGEGGEGAQKAQAWLDNEVLKDSDPFVPFATTAGGTLLRSGITGTTLGEGKIVYNTPYASFQYYMAPNKSHDVHPEATTQWFEKAKSAFKAKWLAGVKKIFGGV